MWTTEGSGNIEQLGGLNVLGMNKEQPGKVEPKMKGRLPACKLDRELLTRLWEVFHRDGEFLWHAEVGVGGDLLGKQEERPKQAITDWEELIRLLQTLPRIDSLTITAEIPDHGVIALAFRNFAPPSGKLVVNSDDQQWAEDRYFDVLELFESKRDSWTTMMHSRWGFGLIQTGIPLTLSCALVVLTAALLIPLEVRKTQWLWWITAATTIITLRLAYTVSDKLIIYAIKKYPYIRIS
ncbi:hypothetical protein HSX37_05775|uniref:hypothetical protein n=1 Tax=Dendrosporobacter quercicolus TaxID=146817 RepID=UPI0011140F41|nr:hypothetical protein [Dendrosporobacter quercicolus]NSL47550.1 hypothetical protein [Dendrosporobacter quercicolus DSM 1736]